MINQGSKISISSVTPQSYVPPSRPPRSLSSFLPFTAQRDHSSPSSLNFTTTPKLRKSDLDPLSNFRADAARPPAITTTMSSEDDMQGIEDITESQWQACPPGRSSDGPSSSSAPREEQGSDDHTRWDGGSGSSTRKRKNWELEQDKPARRELSVTRTPSTSPVLIRGKKPSPISQTPPGEDYDHYDNDMVDDRSPIGSKSHRKHRESSSGILYLSDEEDRDSMMGGRKERRDPDEEEDEEEAAESGSESTHIPTSPTTPRVDTDDEDVIAWDPSPLSPRSLARRNRSMSTSSRRKKPRKSSPSPVPTRDTGGPGPSSTRGARKAADNARARNKKYIVLSDDEDEDYNPYTGGDDEAFTREYERQAEKERDEPEETDGSDQDIDGKDREEEEGGQGGSGQEEEDGNDFFMMASQRPPQPKPVSAAKTNRITNTSNQAGPSRNHGIFQSASKASAKPPAPAPTNDDEYDDIPFDFFDEVDLDAITSNHPATTSNPVPSRNLSNLFSPHSPKRQTPSRVPLCDLPYGNMPPPAPRSSVNKSSLLSRLDGELDHHPAPEPQFHRSNAVLEEDDDDDDDLGYVPVSKMSAKWQDFFMNHWRRGADKSKAIGRGGDEEDEEVAPSRSKAARGTKATKGSTAASGSTRGGKRVTKTAVRRREVDQDEEEDDYEGDLGGHQAPTVSYSKPWASRGRGGYRRGGRGGGRKRGTTRKR